MNGNTTYISRTFTGFYNPKDVLDSTNIVKYNNVVDPATISGIISGISQMGSSAISLAQKEGLQGDVKAACGTKPLFPGPKMDYYKQCAANYTKAQLELQAKQAQSAADVAAIQAIISGQKQKTGLSTGLIITISAVSVLAVGTIAYFLITKR